MNSAATAYTLPPTPFEQLRTAREILHLEARALEQVAQQLGLEFCHATELFLQCRESVIVCGIGKAGLIGQKIAATFASTGTRSHFLHPAEAVHGDLGRVGPGDVVLMLSQSGETEEIVRLLPPLKRLAVPLVAITSRRQSTLGRTADLVLELGSLTEACALGLAPSTSTTAMLALGDALALVTSRQRGFAADDFARLHPGGSLGRRLSRVEDVMRPRHECRVADDTLTVRQVFVEVSRPGRRSGAVMLIDPQRRLSGLFTDSDLARLFESRRDQDFDRPVREVMTASPRTVPLGTPLPTAVDVIAQCKISELPVVDAHGAPLGLVDITDLVGLWPALAPPADIVSTAPQPALPSLTLAQPSPFDPTVPPPIH